MVYQIMIFMTHDLLKAVDISNTGECEVVSIDGNMELEYKSSSDIEKFCNCLKEEYNIDDFSDLNISVLLIKAGAKEEDVKCLGDLLEGINDKNIIGANRVLPFIIAAQGLVEKSKTLVVNILNSFYKLEIDENLSVNCNSIKCEKDSIELTEDMFQIFLNFNGKSFLWNEEKIIKSTEELEEIIEYFRNELQKYLHNEIEKRLYYEIEKIKSKRSLCYLRNKNAVKLYLINPSMIFEGKKLCYKIKFLMVEGSSVRKNQKIATVIPIVDGTYQLEYEDTIIADAEGKLFYLVENDKEQNIETGAVVAIIGDLNDTKTDVLNWYKSLKQE